MIVIIIALAMFNFHAIFTKLVNFKTSIFSRPTERNNNMSQAPCPKATKLKIIYKGNVSCFETNCDQDVSGFITVALAYFDVADAIAKDFKLILVSTCKALDNDSKISDIEDLTTDDELLLVQRTPIHSDEEDRATAESVDRIPPPSEQDILALTADITPKNTTRQLPLGCSSNFLSEIRKIFISLAEASAKMLSVTPEASAVAADLKQRLEAPLDPAAVNRLTGMGYALQDTAAALRLHHMDASAALEWLLASHPVAPPEGETSSSVPAVSRPSTPVPSTALAEEPLVELVTRLVDEFRAVRRRNFRANQRALQNLTEMGFTDFGAIHQALLITGNNQTSACEWMLGERRPSLLDLDSGLDESGPIYASVMANPIIQLGLRSPRVLLAFLSMIENPDCINKWLRDPDASPVISQVFKTYHAEKHLIR